MTKTTKTKAKRPKLTAAEAREADARMEHFLKCLRFQRIYEAAVRARLRTESSNAHSNIDRA
jgi:hypothetical protein